MITIVDYGIGNIASVKNILHRNGAISQSTNDPAIIEQAEKLILPGVGSFDTAMEKLHQLELIDSIQVVAKSGRPLLGICLGAQLLMSSSQEGKCNGLDIIHGICKRFTGIEPLPVPHMGWSEVIFKKKHPLFDFSDIPRFYFVHSYHMVCDSTTDVMAVSMYGHEFTSIVSRENVIGVQFHPEKSHRFGMHLMKNFAAL